MLRMICFSFNIKDLLNTVSTVTYLIACGTEYNFFRFSFPLVSRFIFIAQWRNLSHPECILTLRVDRKIKLLGETLRVKILS